MTLDEWQASGRLFTYRGRRLFYHDEGEGQVLVCIHGFPTASWDWHRLWPVLTAHFRVIAMDMLGFGFSDKPRGDPYSFFNQATLHEVLLQHLGARTVHILAHDYGDTVAQELLARHLRRRRHGVSGLAIRSVCFLNGGLFPEAIRPRPIQKLLESPLGWMVRFFMTEHRFRKSFGAVFGPETGPTPEEVHDFWRLVTYDEGLRIAHKLARYQRERRQYRERWVGALVHTPVPLRLINGLQDPVSGATVIERYKALIPRADVVPLEDAGHYPQFEAPDRVLEAFLAFVDRLDTASENHRAPSSGS